MKIILCILLCSFYFGVFTAQGQTITIPSLRKGAVVQVEQDIILQATGASSKYEEGKITTTGQVTIINQEVNFTKMSIDCKELILDLAVEKLVLNNVTIKCDRIIFGG